MATIAVIQHLHPFLNEPDGSALSGFSKQIHDQFYEVLVEESGFELLMAADLAEFEGKYTDKPDLIICTPIPEAGNVAPGFVTLGTIKDRFPDTPVIVWTERTEDAIQSAVVNDYGAADFYTGTLINAPEDFADLILKHL